MTVLLNEN